MFADAPFKNLSQKSGHRAANGRELLQHLAAIFLLIQGPGHRIKLSPDAR